MDSTITVPSLLAILLLVQTPVSSPVKVCQSDSFFDSSTQTCRECTRHCPPPQVMYQGCREDADAICKPPPVACPSDSFLNPATGRCKECTKSCVSPETIVVQCRPNADAVCDKMERPPSSAEPFSALSPADTPGSSTERPSTKEDLDRHETTALKPTTAPESSEPSQNVTTENIAPDDTSTSFEGTGSSQTSQTHRGIAISESSPTLPSINNSHPVTSEEKSRNVNFHLWIIISVLVIVVIVVVAGLLVYCRGLRCVCTGKKVDKMGAAGRGALNNTQDSNRDRSGSPNTRYHTTDCESPQSPGAGGSGPRASQSPGHAEASLSIRDECTADAEPGSPSSLPGDGVAAGYFTSYEHSYHRPQSSSMTNMYPTAPMPLARSRVSLGPGGAAETHLDYGDHCGRDQCWNHWGNHYEDPYRNHCGHHGHHCCHDGCHGTMATAYHYPQPNYHTCHMSSSFSVVSGGSGYTV